MKLLRFWDADRIKPGIIDSTGLSRDLSEIIDDVTGAVFAPNVIDQLRVTKLENLPLITRPSKLAPCIGGVGKFICIGLNYSDHAEESGMIVPAEPVIFMKATSAISGPNDDIVLPRGSTETDWEVELGVVIGQHAKYVTEADASACIGGYCVVNDLSERAFQLEGTGQWVKGKSADTFGPIGPWLVTPDEVPDPQDLELWLEVNGHRYQHSSTSRMIFGVAHIVSYVSSFMSLQPGDIISTGTPPGVGLGQRPPTYLCPGDVVRLGIQGLGEQTQLVVSERGRASACSSAKVN